MAILGGAAQLGGRLLRRRGDTMIGAVQTFGKAVERCAAVDWRPGIAAAALTMTQTSVPLIGLIQRTDGA